MNSPYAHPFLKRQNTMYLSTLGKLDLGDSKIFERQSSFLKQDIKGSQPRQLIPKFNKKINYSLSTYTEPVPCFSKSVTKRSNPLFIDDIDGARAKNKDFTTKRVVNPLQPVYILPSVSAVQLDKGRKFIRSNLNTQDINLKKPCKTQSSLERPKITIQGSTPKHLSKEVRAIPRLDVNDIIKEQKFESTRKTDPLDPNYQWRDNPDKILNTTYGVLEKNHPRINHPITVNKKNDFQHSTLDIEGAQANSSKKRTYFIDKRRQFRNYMRMDDLKSSQAASLNKGIKTIRQTNPLMPIYQFPGISDNKK